MLLSRPSEVKGLEYEKKIDIQIPLNWEKNSLDPPSYNPIMTGDLDNDGNMEILYGTEKGIWIYHHNSSFYSTINQTQVGLRDFSGTFLNKNYQTELLVLGYIHNGRGDIIAVSPQNYSHGDEHWSHRIEMYSRNGTIPTLNNPIIETDGRIFVGTGVGMVYCWDFLGNPVDGWPRNFQVPLLPVVITEPQGNSMPEIIIAGGNGTIWVTNILGETLASWPQTVNGKINNIAVSDVDGDGEYEICVVTRTGWLYLFRRTGAIKSGWPVQFSINSSSFSSYRTLIADLDSDRYQEIIITGAGEIWVYNWQGVMRNGWSQLVQYKDSQNDTIEVNLGYPVVLDMTGDGLLEIICPIDGAYSTEKIVWIWNADGQELNFEQFNTINLTNPTGHLLIADLNGDSWLEGIMASYDGKLAVFSIDVRGYRPWLQVGGDPSFQSAYNDYDYDGLRSHEEYMLGTDPNESDSDKDGFTDREEVVFYRTDPTNPDMDGDGLSDYAEIIQYGTNHMDNDTDRDNLTDYVEIMLYFTDPTINDTDADGLQDNEEINHYRTNPLDPDCDNDALLDGEEIKHYGTDVFKSDSDNDGLLDGEEIKKYGTDPWEIDSDGDGVADGMEVSFGLNPLISDDVLIIRGILLILGAATSLTIGTSLFLTQRRKFLKKDWKRILQDQHIAPLNIINSAAKAHISSAQAKEWLEEFLTTTSPDRVIGLYNPEKQIFLSQKTLQLWVDTMVELPLESLASSLELSLEDIKAQLQKIDPVQRGEWILSLDYHLHRSRP
ncbi:MAG: hypothetical protein ACXAC8_04500 [Candidatus Hodarchaeales archaeon]